MKPLRKPVTGEAAAAIRVWFTQSGESPNKPYTEKRWMEQRYIKVPGHLVKDTEGMEISTEHGDTPEP